jgi:Rieske Fe-S protein
MTENHTCSENPTEEDATVSRRTFLGKAVFAIHGIIGAVVGLPFLATFLAPFTRNAEHTETNFKSVGRLEDFPVDVPSRVPIMGKKVDAWTRDNEVVLGNVWVVREPSGKDNFTVYTAECPHLGCAIKWSDKNFLCPCHGSQFGVSGGRLEEANTSNPSPRDMDKLEHRLKDGEVWVRFQRFETGTNKTIPIS